MTDFTTLVTDDQKLGVGEILICNKETKGKFEPLKHFIGKVILAIGGGGDKIYIVEEKDKYKSEVKSIQINPNLVKKKTYYNNPIQTNTFNASKNDSYLGQNMEIEDEEEKKMEEENEEKKEQEEENNQDLDESTEREIPAHIVQICKGKYHLIKLTSDGKVHCSGKAYFGVAGLGGSASSEKTKPLPNLIDQKIVQVTCGEFHSMALSDKGDLYTWGMGFEGQLGLSAQYKVASSPRYLRIFFRKPVKFITCGNNFSHAISKSSKLYGWSENKLGQLGLGKVQIVDKPTRIDKLDKYGDQEGCATSESLVNNKLERVYTEKPLKACYVSAGYSHTCVVTEEGYPDTFGLNIFMVN